ncbi:hypothetical protein OAH18_03745, partial [bacterium]|nr:hypothetical protein [bacterium]
MIFVALLMLVASGSAVANEKPIVLFIPGTGGTVLQYADSDKDWWLNPDSLRFHLEDGNLADFPNKLKPAGLLRAVEIKPMDRMVAGLNNQLKLLKLEVVQPTLSVPVYQQTDD